MDDTGFDAEFSAFVRDCIPSLQAAAVLVCIVRDAEREWSAAEIVEHLRTSVSISLAEAERSMEMFESRGLVRRQPSSRTRLARSRLEDKRLRTLVQAYDQKPVTLIQFIHAMREEKIRMFSDAFRIRKD
jgi:hypothetical protein